MTAVSFAVSEQLKLETVPIGDTLVTKVFSPVCGCATDVARVRFRLRRADHVTVTILGMDRHPLRRLASHEAHRPGKLAFAWDGRDEHGRLMSDGTYRIRVELSIHGRTINLPNLIRIDTVKPVAAITVPPHPRTFSPDGDHRADAVVVGYRVSKFAHGLLFVGGRLVVQTRYQRLHDGMEWYGVRDGRRLAAGRYRVAVGARDPAGNLARRVPAGTVTIRYVTVTPTLVRVAPRGLVRLRVETDARAFRWQLGRRHGVSRRGRLTLRAPAGRGRHVLYVEERGHAARVVLFVTG